jgi:hypothetical protein
MATGMGEDQDAIDTRLTRKVTLAVKGIALSDLCAQLGEETKVNLTAGASVADEKVTLFCRAMPLRDVMRQLSRPFGYTWLRSGDGKAHRYELVQDLRGQLLEEELRNRDRSEALLALDREMARFRPYLEGSPGATLARLREALPETERLLGVLSEDPEPWGAMQLYFRLSPQEHAALRAGQTLIFSADPRPGEHPLPADLVEGVRESCRNRRLPRPDGQDGARDDVPAIDTPEAYPFVELRISQGEPGRFSFDGGAGVRVGERGDGCVIGGIALGLSPAAHQPRNSAVNARLAGDRRLQREVSVRPGDPSPQPPPRNGEGELAPPSLVGVPSGTPGRVLTAEGFTPEAPGPAGAGGLGRLTTADVLEALHHATGMPIVSDYFTRLYSPESVTLTEAPLFEALNRLGDAMRLRWHLDRDTKWLQFRSTTYYDDRLKEVPNRLLLRLAAARQKQGSLSLDDLTEIALLSDAQLGGREMTEGAKERFGLAEWDAARHHPPHLRFLAALTPAQRQAATSATGFPLAELSLAQQHQFLSQMLRSEVEWETFLTDLRAIRLQVDYILPERFEWYAPEDLIGPGWPPLGPARVRERTREAALQAARRHDPEVTEAEIHPTELNVRFLYRRADGDTLHLHWFQRHGYWSHRIPAR